MVQTSEGAVDSTITRRAVVKAAAWAVPVIALAVAAPLASASASDATLTVVGARDIQVDAVNGTASGSFDGALTISNVVGRWQTGELDARLSLPGPWSTSTITKPNGDPFIADENITAGGVVWIVYNVLQDAGGVYGVYFYANSIEVSADTTVSFPPAIYSGTFDPGAPTGHNPIAASVSAAAQNIMGGGSVGDGSSYAPS